MSLLVILLLTFFWYLLAHLVLQMNFKITLRSHKNPVKILIVCIEFIGQFEENLYLYNVESSQTENYHDSLLSCIHFCSSLNKMCFA